MKTLVILLLLVPFISFSQLYIMPKVQRTPIGRVYAPEGDKLYTHFLTEIKIDNQISYELQYNYKDYLTQDRQTEIIIFKGSQTLNDFYTLLMSVFLDENKTNENYIVNFFLGDKMCYIKTNMEGGKTTAKFRGEKGSACFTEKEINELFGK